MFFSNSCKSKKLENWLVLVLTDWNLEPRSPKYRKIMTGDSKLLPKPPKWVRFYLLGNFFWKKPGHSKFQSVTIYLIYNQNINQSDASENTGSSNVLRDPKQSSAALGFVAASYSARLSRTRPEIGSIFWTNSAVVCLVSSAHCSRSSNGYGPKFRSKSKLRTPSAYLTDSSFSGLMSSSFSGSQRKTATSLGFMCKKNPDLQIPMSSAALALQ